MLMANQQIGEKSASLKPHVQPTSLTNSLLSCTPILNPQSNPHLMLSYTTSAYLGSPVVRGVCKLLKNLMVVPCHGRGRGFEPRRPRHSFSEDLGVNGPSQNFTPPTYISTHSYCTIGVDLRSPVRFEASCHLCLVHISRSDCARIDRAPSGSLGADFLRSFSAFLSLIHSQGPCLWFRCAYRLRSFERSSFSRILGGIFGTEPWDVLSGFRSLCSQVS